MLEVVNVKTVVSCLLLAWLAQAAQPAAASTVSVSANVGSHNCISYYNGTSSAGCTDFNLKLLPNVSTESLIGSAETSYDLTAAPEISATSTVSSATFS